MIFGLVCFILVLGVAYFHWVQGLFSAIISMVFAITAASIALAYHETIVTSLLGGKMADMANGMIICVLFAAVYGIGRIVFDSLIPGNVRVPLYLDKVGGAACGLVAGIFGVGTVAIAAQSLPFGPSIAGFDRYSLVNENKIAELPGRRGQNETYEIRDALDIEAGQHLPAEAKRNALMMPVDQWVLDFVRRQSADGSLSTGDNGPKLDAQHPDLLRELFLQRVGIENGAKHSAMNINGKKEVSVSGLFAPTQLNSIDGEPGQIRSGQAGPFKPGIIESKGGTQLLVIRTSIKADAAEKDAKLRFSLGMARLVVNGMDYYPIGTMGLTGNMVFLSRVDDFLLGQAIGGAAGDVPIDFVYRLPTDVFTAAATPAAPTARNAAPAVAAGLPAGARLKPGAFFEFKRLARVDLSDMDVTAGPPPALPVETNENGQPPVGGVIRKEVLVRQLANPANP